MLDISIVVATYNFDYKKLFNTLYSIIIQKNVTFEIIIADDASKNFDNVKIEEWFKKNGYLNYKIVRSSSNQGTVKNVYEGVKNAEGRYIKLISPGDFLYDENTLFKFVNFLKTKNEKIVFGKAYYYSIEQENKVNLYNCCNPINLKPYIKFNLKNIQYNYIKYQDFILGAALVSEKGLFLKYVKKIIDVTIYAEDYSYYLMILDNIKISFLNERIIWYEYGTGISTNKNKQSNKLLENDQKNFYKVFGEKYKLIANVDNLFYRKRYISKFIHKVKNKFYRMKYNSKKIRIDDSEIEKLNKIIHSN